MCQMGGLWATLLGCVMQYSAIAPSAKPVIHAVDFLPISSRQSPRLLP